MTPPPGRTPTRTERLDALPFTREHRRLLLGSGAGWALDALDVGLISFVLAQLAVQWDASDTELSWIASAGFVGMALGASLGGLLADRIGRRSVFALTLLVYGLATGASALAGSVAVLIVLRFVVGLGLGAELPVASTLVSEFAPPRIRGRVVVALEAFWAVGWSLAAVVGYLVVPASDDGWRWALAIGAVPALYSAVVRAVLPESVRFLESRGRSAEADAVVQRFERAAGVAPEPTYVPPATATVTDGGSWTPQPMVPGPRLPSADESAPARPAAAGAGGTSRTRPGVARLTTLWTPTLRARTAALWVVWFTVNFAYYGAFIWLPTILVADGFTLVRSFEYTLWITLAQLPGYAASAVLVEVWGRRRTLASFLAGSAVAAALFASADTEQGVLVTGMLLSFFNLGAWGALYAVTPELYPTTVRGTGAGAAAGFGRLASVLAPFAVLALRDAGGTSLLFGVFAATFVVAAIGAFTLPERQGLPLDE